MTPGSADHTDPGAGVHVQGAVRSSAKFGVRHTLRRWWVTRGIGALGKGVHVDRNVRLLRHPHNVFISDRVMLKEGARICPAQPTAKINIGQNTTIGYHTFIFASAGISIGDNCLIAPLCYLVDANHSIERSELIRAQPLSTAPITLGDDVWLGARVTVLPGVTIGTGAVVAAGSVVSRDIPEYAVSAGAPAEVKRFRE